MSPITEAMKPSRNSDRQSCASSGELFPKNGTAFATESPTTFVSSRPTIFGSSRRAGRVWQRLLERHGTNLVPNLVFAGKIGWLVDELLDDLEASGYLNGKIILLRNLSDAELQQAYHSCLFTVFPSLSEGWGLPIAESLAHGKF